MTIKRRINTGDRFPTDAATLNAWNNAARKAVRPDQKSRRRRRPGDPLPPGLLWIRNDTGVDLVRSNIVEPDHPLNLPWPYVPSGQTSVTVADQFWSGDIAFRGIKPSADDVDFAVCLENIKQNEVGLATEVGSVAVNVKYGAAGRDPYRQHDFVIAEEDNVDNLVSRRHGSPIIWMPEVVDGAGNFATVVRLGSYENPLIKRCVANGDIAAGVTNGTATVSWTAGGGGTETLSDVALDWVHGDEKVSDGNRISLLWNRLEKVYDIVLADCEEE